ncbi:MAG: aldo/keto reductase [SAR324 cluster bacterium]|nr:aldo/keto reductase [Pseudomonadota bacterium]MDP6093800.1 aldo/keto reductase [SAR324 cluster bacterium]MDP6637708.1 aldo/keto reductase [SAR324 cluster bacterium]MDP6729990.1 aldo/keto reductase [SAR324 cluster bacterium]MEE1576626.1 aldo/keto reductase [Deltaproteobacteria bacterium]
MSSAVLFGGAALAKSDQDEADRVLDLLFEFDINHIDTAAAYGDSELRIGPWMKKHRKTFFLATKTRERTYPRAREQIRASLDRLCTDHLDMIQLHALIHPDEWEQALSAGGALEAAIEAREEGLVRFIGVTGHGWNVAAMHKRSLQRFNFDSVLMPWNYFASQHQTYAPDFFETWQICRERDIAVQTIKSIARGPWAAGAVKSYKTWYEPLKIEEDISQAIGWILSQQGLFLNSAGDVKLLPAFLRAASQNQQTPEDAEMEQLSQKMDLASIFGL